MTSSLPSAAQELLQALQRDGLYKQEHCLHSAQAAQIRLSEQAAPYLSLCSNNYLNLANHPQIIAAAQQALSQWGYGMASVRFICGTQPLHGALEARIAQYVGMEAAITFAACFDANAAVFEALLGPQDAVLSDKLNHASIIDGIRLCKAKRYTYSNCDLDDLQRQLNTARQQGARHLLVVTDGVFSMDGHICPLAELVQLARRYEAWVMVDDSHACGVLGPQGRGTPALHNVQVDLITGTFGKALGGALGGFIAAAGPVVDWLRQRARPYLFSNALPPVVLAGNLVAIELAQQADAARQHLQQISQLFRQRLCAAGLRVLPGEHPIVPLILGDAQTSQAFAQALQQQQIHAVSFSYPVVPQGQARIRSQLNAALTQQQVMQAADTYIAVAKRLRLIH